MRRRLVDIYKRGPLYSFEALLSAKSFGDLLTRYKYLRTIAQEDRARVKRMEDLKQKVSEKHNLLSVLTNELSVSRDEQAEEERRLRALEDQWQRRAANPSQSAAALQRQIQSYIAAEKRMADLVAESEAARARDPRAAAAVASKPLPSADRGRLDWPVDGEILYPYGRLMNPNRTTIRWNGIGIAAPLGTPVKAVADGVVVAAQHMSTYGTCVVLLHGDDYSMYCSLAQFSVTEGQSVQKGQQIGTVGVNNPEMGSHLHFEIRVKPEKARVHMAIDPLEWLSPSLGCPTEPGLQSRRPGTRRVSVPPGACAPASSSPSSDTASGTWLCPTRTSGVSVSSNVASAASAVSTYSQTGSRALA